MSPSRGSPQPSPPAAGEGSAAAIGSAEVTTQQVLHKLGLIPSPTDLSEVIRVRVDRDLLESLDRIEALIRGQGYRDVTRSSLIRAAISGFVEAVEQGGSADDETTPRRTTSR